ncbi:hypothetical protein CONLIGDRAFT_716274 [Coniochaeta ligniaria NRRL 30616]|uniref:Uncharacterized protein n=1 Tax=Coniochaeta ligniaria NRRL 30616 TaxID=1408157 RepID=A0A1J7JJP4_9PEZI|nr:hypothetical protein CONLIGDRAFT_716274 [Coniochaeta ligniaria NRRL 30616]
MPSIRAPVLRTALQPSARFLPRTQPFLTQIRQDSTNPDDKRTTGYRLDGSRKPEDKGTTTGYRLDGTSSLKNNRGIMYIAGIAAILGGVYFVGVGKPDAAAESGLKREPDNIRHRTGSDRQRVGGPERSEK